MKKPEHCDLQVLASIIIGELSKANILKLKGEKLESRINTPNFRIDIVLIMADSENVNLCRTVNLCLIDLLGEPPIIRIFPLLRALNNEAAKKLEQFANAVKFEFDEVYEETCDQIRKLLYNQHENKPLKTDK